jgi:hypothetical protein
MYIIYKTMAETIIDGTQFNVQSIKYTAPKANASGGKSINILNKATNTGLRLSTPIMLTWGASDFENNGKFDMALQFPSDEYKNADTEAFLQNLIALEAKIKADALVYSKEWFGKQHKSADVVDALFSPMLKYSRNKVTGDLDLTKAPSFRVKIPFWEGVWKCEIYDEEHNRMFPNTENPNVTPVDFLQKGINVACLLQCGGLWFANGKFGITWKLIQAVSQKPRATLSGQCFIKLKTADKEKLKAVPLVASGEEQEDEESEQPHVSSTQVEDSDEEEEDEPEIAPTPVAVQVQEEPKVVKKKIVKKKASE